MKKNKKKNSAWYTNPSTIVTASFIILLLGFIGVRIASHSKNEIPAPAKTQQASYSLVLAPSLLKKNLDEAGKALLVKAFVDPAYYINLSFFNLPSTKTEYFNEQSYLGKNFYNVLVSADADFGVLPTFEFLKLVKFKTKIIPVYTYSKRSRDGLFGLHMAQVIVLENSDIKSLENLKEKRIATFLPENELFFPVKMFFQSNEKLDFKIVLTRDLEKSLELLKQRKVDALVVSGYSFEDSKEYLSSFSHELKGQNSAAPSLREVYRYETKIPSHIVFAKTTIPEATREDVLSKLEETVLKPEIDQLDIMTLNKLSDDKAEEIMSKLSALTTYAMKIHEYQEPYVENTQAPNKDLEECVEIESERCKNFLNAKLKDNNDGVDLGTFYQGMNLGEFKRRVDAIGPNDKEELRMLLILRGYNERTIENMLNSDLSEVKASIKYRYEVQRQEKARLYVEWLMD